MEKTSFYEWGTPAATTAKPIKKVPKFNRIEAGAIIDAFLAGMIEHPNQADDPKLIHPDVLEAADILEVTATMREIPLTSVEKCFYKPFVTQ